MCIRDSYEQVRSYNSSKGAGYAMSRCALPKAKGHAIQRCALTTTAQAQATLCAGALLQQQQGRRLRYAHVRSCNSSKGAGYKVSAMKPTPEPGRCAQGGRAADDAGSLPSHRGAPRPRVLWKSPARPLARHARGARRLAGGPGLSLIHISEPTRPY